MEYVHRILRVLLRLLILTSFVFPDSLLADSQSDFCLSESFQSSQEAFAIRDVFKEHQVPTRTGLSYEYVLAVRYTPAAAVKVGGKALLQTQIESAVLGANTLLRTSGIHVQIKLAYLEEVVSDADFSCPQCAALDKTHRPDAFAFIEETGLAYASIPTSISQALRGASLSFGVQNFKEATLAHEVGHTLGLGHGAREIIDTTVAGSVPSEQPATYGQGVVAVDQNGDPFHTIMSYGNISNTSVRSGLFSSPNLIFNGVPTGTETANSVRAANFWAQYVTAAGENNFPLPISLAILKDGKHSIFSGRCLDEVGGSPSVGAQIELFQETPEGTMSELGIAECDSAGSFLLKFAGSLEGKFRAFHTKILQSSEWVEPLWAEFSLFVEVSSSRMLFHGVCFAKDGTTPLTGSPIKIFSIGDSEDLTVAETLCTSTGTYESEMSSVLDGRFWAQIPGVAFSDIVEVKDGESSDDPGGTKCDEKKIKKLKKRIRKASTKSQKKKLQKKMIEHKQFC